MSTASRWSTTAPSPGSRSVRAVGAGSAVPEAGESAEAARGAAVFPLRVMSQDEVFSAAIAVIRRSPRAVLGLPLVAGLLNFAVTAVLLLVLPSNHLVRMMTDPTAFEDPELVWAAMGDVGLWLLLMLTGSVSTLLLALSFGLLGIPSLRAAYGLPTTLGQTLRLRAGTIGWLLLHLVLLGLALGAGALVVLVAAALLVGLTLFVGVVVVLPALFLLLCWVTAAFMFGPLVIVVERRNAFSAVARSFRLNRGLWWRHIGAVALLYLIGGIAMMVATLPASLVLGLGAELAWQSPQGQNDWLALAVLGLGQLYDAVVAAVMVALAATAIAALYLNARFRQEALDVVLLHAAGSAADTDQMIPGSPEHLTGHLYRQQARDAYV
ncbi:hypothetical protein [Nesterenkonia sp.]|uniref:hypothetical protein n=1 Tax=Nesterenkonia sp. TaxID=704201 RepID=UPI002631A82E|nr:hypothetical protein [Nesterenkonia sp.]